MSTLATDQPHTMQCMEVWGSNRAVDNGVVMPGLDAWVYARPCADDDEGGDVHYVSACATGRVIRALVADVSGHGATVGSVSSDLRSLMRRYINFVDQRRFLNAMNRQFQGLDESGHFATAVVATCWTPSDEITVSCAGHPSPLRYRAADRAWSPILKQHSSGDIPLGLDKATSFRETRLRLDRDDLVLLYSDGLIEARNADGVQLGIKGLTALLDGLDPGAPDAFLRELLAAVDRYQGGRAIDDDLTLMLLRPNALKPRPSLMTALVAGKRVASGVLRSILTRQPAPTPEITAPNLLGAFSNRFNAPKKP